LWKLIATSPANIRYEILKTWYKSCVTVFVVTLCDDGTESSKKCYDAFVSKEVPMGLHYFCTILSNLALGHEIDRHFWRGVELK